MDSKYRMVAGVDIVESGLNSVVSAVAVDERSMLESMLFAVARCGDSVELTVFQNGLSCTVELSPLLLQQLIDCLRGQ